MTYEQAIAKLVEHDVAKWGESERVASERLHRREMPTLALALAKVATLDVDYIDRPELTPSRYRPPPPAMAQGQPASTGRKY